MDPLHMETQIHEGYTLLLPEDLGPGVLDALPSRVEELLMQKKQDVVLSLREVDTVFSMHLTAFVQLYRLLKSFNLRFIVVDISPAVLNVMQMTQLDSLIPLFLSLDDFVDGLEQKSEDASKPLDFSYSLGVSEGKATVRCRGYMAFGETARKLQEDLSPFSLITLNLAEVGYIDTRVLILLADLSSRHKVQIQGASAVIQELFVEHRMNGRVEFLD